MSFPIAAIPQIAELNIGHFLIGEAIFTGLDASVRRMRELMDEAREPYSLSRERERDRGEGLLLVRRGRSHPHPSALRASLPLPRAGEGSDRRHRLRPVQHRAHPEFARPLGRQVPRTASSPTSSGSKAASRPHTIAGTLAKRFAAKEAFSKAVGTGFKRGVFMKDIGVVNLPSGAPTLQLTGGARARLDALAPEGHAIDIHLTMTDDHPWAQAFVILTARKLEP